MKENTPMGLDYSALECLHIKLDKNRSKEYSIGAKIAAKIAAYHLQSERAYTIEQADTLSSTINASQRDGSHVGKN
jgi:hypothetical protein